VVQPDRCAPRALFHSVSYRPVTSHAATGAHSPQQASSPRPGGAHAQDAPFRGPDPQSAVESR
jgi:hypothetical protein